VARLNTAGQMASNLAHEISQPLTALLNFAHAARRRIGAGQATPDLVAEALEQIVLQGERAGQIVQGVREFVGRHVPDRQSICRPSAVERAVRFVSSEALRNRVHIQVQCCATPCQVLAEVSQIEQVLVNLIKNGVEAVGESASGGVSVRWSDLGTAVEIVVLDEGPGISGTKNLFVPFFTTKPKGSGIGLVLCRQIAEAHGGSLTLENRTDRTGCAARLVLPK